MAIFQKRGKWWIGYRGNDGRRRREPVGLSHALAKQVLAKRLNEVAEQRHFPGRVANSKPFGIIADLWWEQHGRFLRSRSWKNMLDQLRLVFGTKRVGGITPGDIQGFYNRKAEGQSTSTANRYLTLLKMIFNSAESWGHFYGQNPCARVRKGQEAPHRLRYLSQDEIKRLLGASHPRLYPVVACAILTGMRQGEILGLTWENVSLESDTIYLLRTKSGKPRELPIPGKLRAILLAVGPKPAGPVFELPLIMLRRYFDRALREASIPGFRFHDLRHTFASHFIMRTNDLPALQKLLGHSTPLMTLRYAHLGRGHLMSEIAAFESAIPVSTDSYLPARPALPSTFPENLVPS
jgi:integrase